MQRLHQSYLLRLLGFVSHLEWSCFPFPKLRKTCPVFSSSIFLNLWSILILFWKSWVEVSEMESVFVFFFPSWLLNQDALVAGNRMTTSDRINRGLLFDIRILEVGSFRLDEAEWASVIFLVSPLWSQDDCFIQQLLIQVSKIGMMETGFSHLTGHSLVTWSPLSQLLATPWNGHEWCRKI